MKIKKLYLLIFIFLINVSFQNINKKFKNKIIDKKCVILFVNDKFHLILDSLKIFDASRNDLVIENYMYIDEFEKFIKNKNIHLIKINTAQILKFKTNSNKIYTINLIKSKNMVDIYYFNTIEKPLLVEDYENDFYKCFKINKHDY